MSATLPAPPLLCRGYLLDTSVVSALAPDRKTCVPSTFADWLQLHDAQLFLPAIAVAELAQGIAKLHRSGGVERAQQPDRSLDGLIAGFADRILPFDAQTARLAGRISNATMVQGKHSGFPDVAIAALAQNARL